MSLRQYLEHRTDETDGSEVLQKNHRDVSEQQLVPRIIKRNREAILVDPHSFHFFQRKKQGRRCSCFKIESSPDGLCQVCFGTGVVAGYEKFGTVSDMFDVTFQRTQAVNVRQDFDSQTRPVMWRLTEGALRGHIEFDWQIKSSIRKLDLFQIISRDVGKEAHVQAYVRTVREDKFRKMTRAVLAEILCENRAVIRVELSRDNPDSPYPVLSHVYIRYLLLKNTTIQMDVPRVPESISLAEYGVFDSFSTMTGWITDEVKKVSTEDFFYKRDDGTFWKAIEANPNRLLGQNVSHDVTLRLIQGFEQYRRFPV